MLDLIVVFGVGGFMRTTNRLAWAAVLASIVVSFLATSCSQSPTLDDRLKMSPREYPRHAPVEGIRDARLDTAGAMYASAELLRGTAAYYARFTDLVFDAVKSEEAETTLTFEALWLARYNVETLDWVSGMGVPLRDADAKIAALVKAAGLQGPPIRNLLPISLPFASGDPHFTRKIDLGTPPSTPPDAATMRFDPKRTDRRLRPDVIALTMWAEIELARALLAPTHAIDEAGTQQTPGKTNEDYFNGLLLLTLASEKARLLKDTLLMTGSFHEPPKPLSEFLVALPTSELRKYIPHRLALVGDPGADGTLNLRIVEPISYLGDLAAVLLAASELSDASDPSQKAGLPALFAAGGVLPAGVHETATTLARATLQAIVALHDAPDQRVPVTYVSLEERGTTLRIADASLLALALQSYRAHVEGGAPEVESLERKLNRFLLGTQYYDGSYTAAFDAKTWDAAEPREFSATVQGQAIRGLLVAFDSTGDFAYRRAAVRTQQYLDDQLWSFEVGLYRSEEVITSGQKYSRYRPALLGSVAAGLRELSITARDPAYADKLVKFIGGVLKMAQPGAKSDAPNAPRRSLLQSELAATGEDSPEAFDKDGDYILNAPFADGPYGVAPVFATEVVRLIP